MTPSRSGRMATMLAGVRPTMRLASAPMASTRLLRGPVAEPALAAGIHGDDTRLADDDAAMANGDQRVGRAEIDPDVVAEEAEQAVEESHGPSGIVLRPPVARRGRHEDGLRLRGMADAGETLAHGLRRGADQDRSVASAA